MVPVHLKCSLTSPSFRSVSGAYRVDSGVNSPVTWPVDPTDRVVGAGLLLCDARLVEDARHHDRWDAPLRSRPAGPPSAREPMTLRAPVPPVPCRFPLSLSSPMLRSFSEKLAGKFRQPAIAARDVRTGRAPPILPLIPPRTGVRCRIRGEFTGEMAGRSDRPCDELPSAGHGRASGAPPPGGGSASLRNGPLDAAVAQIHRRGLGAPGPAQGCPLWRQVPRWTRRTWAIHPAALSRLLRGVARRDQLQGNPSGSRR